MATISAKHHIRLESLTKFPFVFHSKIKCSREGILDVTRRTKSAANHVFVFL